MMCVCVRARGFLSLYLYLSISLSFSLSLSLSLSRTRTYTQFHRRADAAESGHMLAAHTQGTRSDQPLRLHAQQVHSFFLYFTL